MANAKVELGTHSQKSMTCWAALGQAVFLLIGLDLLIRPSLSFCISANWEGHAGGVGSGGGWNGSWAALAEVWKVQPKPAGLWLQAGQRPQLHTLQLIE